MCDKKLSDVEIDGYLSRIRTPAAVMLRTTNQTDIGMPGCWFGGEPSLPADIEWPVYKCPWPKVDIPMHFIFQINLKYVPKSLDFPDYPDKGILFVFVEPMLAPEDDHSPIPPLLNGQGARVIYVPEDVSRCRPRKAPPLPDLDEEHPPAGTIREAIEYESYFYMRDTYGVTSATGLHRWPMNFVVVDTYPGTDFIRTSKPDRDTTPYKRKEVYERIDALGEAVDEYCYYYGLDRGEGENEPGYGKTPHTIFGSSKINYFPTREVVDNIYCEKSWPALTDRHVVLFRILADDPSIGYCYRNINNLSFWIDKTDLANGKFENVMVWEEI